MCMQESVCRALRGVVSGVLQWRAAVCPMHKGCNRVSTMLPQTREACLPHLGASIARDGLAKSSRNTSVWYWQVADTTPFLEVCGASLPDTCSYVCNTVPAAAHVAQWTRHLVV